MFVKGEINIDWITFSRILPRNFTESVKLYWLLKHYRSRFEFFSDFLKPEIFEEKTDPKEFSSYIPHQLNTDYNFKGLLINLHYLLPGEASVRENVYLPNKGSIAKSFCWILR